MSGRIVTVEYVMNEVLADIEYYRQSNGGITLSGGEPVLQHSFSKEILSQCKKTGLHTIIQTAGNYDYACLEQLLPFTDLVMYDIKAYSQKIYEQHINGDRETILSNLERLSNTDIPIVARTPVVGSVNDNESEIVLIASYLKELKNIKKYILLPYHNLGDVKYDTLGLNRKHCYYSPDETSMALLTEIASKYVTV
jgi:pyruvate formate lyase activating enzyme